MCRTIPKQSFVWSFWSIGIFFTLYIALVDVLALHSILTGSIAFPQVYLLNRRFQQHQQIIWQGKGGVQDRTIYEDSVFAKVNHTTLPLHIRCVR